MPAKQRATRAVAVAAALAVAAAGAALGAPAAQAQVHEGSPTGSSVPTAGAPALLDPGTAVADRGGHAVGTRRVEVRTDLLRAGQARRVSLDLTSTTLVVDLVPMSSGADGWSAWTGAVEGDPEGTVTLVRKGDDVAAVLSSPRSSYRIRTVAPGRQVTEQLSAFHEGPDVLVPPSALDAAGTDPAVPPTAGDVPLAAGDVPVNPVIEVLVAYTPGALSDAGSISAVNSEAALAIADTNAAYAASGVLGTVHLAGVTSVATDFTFGNPGLYQLTSLDDGVEDSIHAKRDAAGADLVSVLIDDDASCGLAWLMENLGNADRGYGFSIIEYSCAVGNHSFAHELGHNMGLNHDHYAETEGGELFPYAYGHINVAKGWRTIMAYNDECAAAATYCTRLGRFSNPSQSYGGDPLGRAFNGSNPADNRRALDLSQGSIASYRAQPAPFTSWTRFVAQQFRDFNGRNPSSAESTTDGNKLKTGATSPEQYVDAKVHGAFGSAYSPVARLYFAYFLRAPDKGGLDHWVEKYRAGTPLRAVSSNFAASSEFRTAYGERTNQGFVELVYQNVLGRPGDAGGISYWTGQLNAGKKTRGAVMVGFSESSEFTRTRAEEIDVVLLYRGLFRRGATSSEFTTAVGALEGGKTVRRLILELLDSSGYAARITA